jgi:hypothetical protein
MRVTSVILCVSVVITGSPIAAQAQSASTVIERHINAIGGKKAIEQIVSTDVSGRVSSADGRSGVFTQRTLQFTVHKKFAVENDTSVTLPGAGR